MSSNQAYMEKALETALHSHALRGKVGIVAVLPDESECLAWNDLPEDLNRFKNLTKGY